MYIDLHGHSRKHNVFMYGCDDKKKSNPLISAFPKFFSCHSIGGKYVNFPDCSFHVRKGRESTARVVVSQDLNIPLSFTLEASFCGPNYGPYQVRFQIYFLMNSCYASSNSFNLIQLHSKKCKKFFSTAFYRSYCDKFLIIISMNFKVSRKEVLILRNFKICFLIFLNAFIVVCQFSYLKYPLREYRFKSVYYTELSYEYQPLGRDRCSAV
jgi:hypothetical protein